MYNKYIDFLRSGDSHTARGQATHARYGVTILSAPCSTWRRSKDNPLIGFSEGLQFLAGMADVSEIARVAPHARLDLFTPMSMYGSRERGQIVNVVKELSDDLGSRRAVVVLADKDDEPDNRPCTMIIHFFVNAASQLYTSVYMRSSDAVWGLPYDLIQFSIVSGAVGIALGLPLANIAIYIGNAHIYDTHINVGPFEEWVFNFPLEFVYSGSPVDRIMYMREMARKEVPLLTFSRIIEKWNFRKAE